eukprot:TRINITY_DN5607_c0_g1_i1.p1 TRINITY_DN5607_c0_g1~~TRINITY_DN5607_c0_g1_i1.p1  ORF type:complete len:120 (+),score=30.88 TRINITY_DN5607_c0_g1_i1:31-390(+)
MSYAPQQDPNAPLLYNQAPPPQGYAYVGYQQPTPAAPTTYVVVQSNNDAILARQASNAWVLFFIGFFFPICWWIGACMYMGHPHPSAKRAGIASLVAAIVNLIVGIIVIIIFFTTVRIR